MKNRILISLFLGVAGQMASQAQSFRPAAPSQFQPLPGDGRSVNFVDVNGDGLDDLFISNGPKGGENNALYLNDGRGRLVAVNGDNDLVKDLSPSDGATFADMDNDGDPDAFVVTWYGAPNYLYRNQGNGSFIHEKQAGPSQDSTFSETAAWGDYDGDGLVDLYITNSTDFRINSPAIRRNILYHNEGEGRFSRIDTGACVTDAHISRGAFWVDYDNDGDPDLFVTNEENQANDLYRNEGGGFLRPVSNALTSDTLTSMGASWGDVDNDGDPDCFIANFNNQGNQLFFNDGRGSFSIADAGDLSRDGGCSFGSAFADYDNDGDLDLFVTNAFCRGTLRNFFYINDGAGRFTRDSTAFPDLTTRSSYGVAWGDIDNDGSLDLAVANCRLRQQDPTPAPTLYRNSPNGNHWLRVRLSGTRSNRQAIGAKVRLMLRIDGKEVWQVREISAQTGYCGQNGLYAHFGLGKAIRAEALRIEWPAGGVTKMKKLKADQVLSVREKQ